MLTALVFNICLVLLPAAAAAGLYVTARDHLYAYQYSDAGARAVRTRIEARLGDLIMLDFDRQRQWEDLIGMELTAGDVAAARGFLLSAREMLPRRDANLIERRLRSNATDADIELATLELLAPSARARYEGTVPLLSRRAASGVATDAPQQVLMLGDQADFELLAGALLADPTTDPTHLVLTGFGLGLAGELTPQQRAGASALAIASRRQDYPSDFAESMADLLATAVPPAALRAAALANAEGGQAGAFDNLAAAFRGAVDQARLPSALAALDEIGAMSAATSQATAALLLTHGHSIRDLPRLRLIAQAGGDRAAAAAKRLPHDTELAEVARGELDVTRDLATAIAVAGIAAAGLLLCVVFMLMQVFSRLLARMRDDADGAELVETFAGGGGRFRPL
ncbi:hypothetical protein U91I_03928 [alpha proteobacterium U9-1i]|nr:hypothetical protein U91I_03928 [alpha proteobacterium U9-1i]